MCLRDSRSLPVFPVDPEVCVILRLCVSGIVGLYPCFPSILKCVWSSGCVFQGQSVFTRVSRRSWSVCDPPAVCFRDSRSLLVFPVDPGVCVWSSGCVFQGQSVFTRVSRRSWSVCDSPAVCFRDSRSLPVFPVDPEVCVILRLCVSGTVGLYSCFPSILKCVWSSGCVFQG